MYQAVSKYNMYNFGGYVSSRIELDIESAYAMSRPHVPVLVMHTGRVFVDVKRELTQFATERAPKVTSTTAGGGGGVEVISLGGDEKIKLALFDHALKKAMSNGGWVIVENAHLVTEWPASVLSKLHVSSILFT